MASYEELKKRVANGESPGSQVSGRKSTYEELKERARKERFEEDVRNVDSSYIDRFVSGANSYFGSAGEAFDKVGLGNATQAYLTRRDSFNDLDYRRSVIQKWMENNREQIDPESYQGFYESLENFGVDASGILDSFSGARDFYNQFETEDDYLAYLDYQEKSKFDLAAGQKEIDDLKAKRDEMVRNRRPPANSYLTGETNPASSPYGAARQQGTEQEKALAELNRDISRKIQYLNQSRYIQDGIAMAGVTENADFGKYSGYQSTELEGTWDRATSKLGMGYGDLTYEFINGGDTGIRDAIIQKALKLGHYDQKILAYAYMTEDQIAIYNYHYAKEGREAAEKYLNSIQESLNYRLAEAGFGKMKDKTGLEMLFGIAAGLDQFKTGISSFFNTKDDYIPQTAVQMASGMVREDLKTAGPNRNGWIGGALPAHIGYDVITTTTNMAPSMLTSMAFGMINPAAGAIAGNALTFASSAGNAYQDALNRGYDKSQARMYSALVGGSEVGLQYFLGGISSLGGKVSGKAINAMLEGVDNAFLRFAGEFGVSMIAEGFEEGLQEILTPMFENMVLYADTDINWEEVTYSFLLGSLTAGFMEGPSTVNSAVNTHNINREMKNIYGSDPGALVSEALEIDPENAFAQKMRERLDMGKDLSGGQINRLVQQNEAAMTAQDMSAIQSAAAQRLAELGETGDVDTIAAALARQAAGEELSRAEERAVRNSKYGQRVANELNTENIQSGGYASGWAEQIGTNRINAQEYGRIVKAAQKAQETKEAAGGQVVANERNEVQVAQNEPETATVRENRTVEVQKEAAQVADAEESSATQETGTAAIEEAARKYGAQAKAMIHTYQAGQDVAKFDAAYQAAYDMGRSGVSLSYAMKSGAASYLTDSQKELAYEAGKAAADAKASAKDAQNKAAANGKTGWKQGGVVRGEGVTTADLKKAFRDTRGSAYKSLSTIAKVTGVNIVLYKSQMDADGNFVDAQGEFNPAKPNEIRIDINAGLENVSDVDELEKYVLLRTFSHEFTHFIEKWNPIQYNEFRRAVFDILTERGMDVDSLIARKMEAENLDYEAASREVVAEAMTDILQDANFVENLAQKHQTIFRKLLEKLKEFARNIKEYFDTVGLNDSMEANALKEHGKYLDSIVKLWDEIAVQAVENYQQTVAADVVVAKNENATTVSETESVLEHRTSDEQPTEAVSKTETTTSVHGFTITDNTQYGSLEISFKGKPSETVRDVLKENKFRWHKTKKVWYGKADRSAITKALNEAFEAEKAEASLAAPEQSDFEKAFWNASQAERDEVVDAINENTQITHMAPTEIRESVPVAEIEEAKDHGEESRTGSDTAAVHESVRGSEGPARLLEGVEPEPVQGSSEGRQPVQPGSDQGTGDAGRDRQPDAAGNELLRGQGSGLGGDLQQLPAVTTDATDNSVGDKRSPTAEDTNVPGKSDPVKLHEEVVEQIQQKSTVNPKGSNFVIGESLNLPNGTKARVRANIDAIRLVKQIAAEGRFATAAEQEILSKYVGWGGLADAFGKPTTNYTTRKIEYEAVKGLEAEFEELKTVLTEDEYKSARESTKNAHYTSIEVIKAMYDGLKQLGFTGGRMLEPSSGVGNFVGAMPADMTAQVKSWTMVELDNITGLFAKYLYPNADVRIQGFENANIPDGYMDVAIGNVPFGNYGITDKHYPKTVTGSIHNYFFAKALDKVRPGGLVMFITSRYTMDARDSAVRKYMAQRADLLGAIRLPSTAFAGNAGTEVVTDILILKKRADRTAYAGEDFENVTWHQGTTMNSYFAQHPEMVMGEITLGRGMYANYEMIVNPFKDKGSLGDQIRKAMGSIQGKMDYSATLSPEKANFHQASAKKKSQKLQVKDGVIQAKDENGNLTRVDVDKDTAERITGMVEIRDAHVALCDALQQGVKKQEITKLRKALNKAYDSFVEKYGYLNALKNKKAINAFADRYAILSLENYSTEGKKLVATKTDIFTKDTIAANRTAQSAETVEEGLTISLNSVGSVDVQMIARLTGEPAESVQRQLIDQRLVFKDKDGNLIPAAQYLSGNVRAKLREMEGLTGIDSDYQNNVEALREVVPATVEHTDIYVNPGANWVPAQVYEDFVGYILKRYNHTGWRTGKKDFSVEYVPETNEYKVSINDSYAKMSAQNTQVWGEGGKSFSTIFENMLNGRRTNVYKDAGDGTRVLDKAKTEAVAEKVEKLNEEFRKWLWEDEGRRAEMQELYNETYNALVTPKYSGANLTVNGMNSAYELRPHQKDAVARIINSGGNTLLAHRVGAGKTMEMAAAAMKLKQLGVIKKPMFAVPNNVVAQWGKEFKDYFPAANILMVGDEDMTPAERMTTINKIKNNDYDAVILAYTKFEKIQMTSAWRQRFYEEQIDSILFAINSEKESQGGKGFTVKQLETKRKQLEARVKKLTEKAKDEDGAMFEDLGVDSLFVDEAHNFKNLEYSTRMNNVSGLGKADGSQRAFDLYTKVRYLQQLNGGRGVVFATATPVMNSMTEMYIMQKYLQPDTLKQLGIEHFDSWAKMFGEVVNALEIAPSGSGYRLKQTFSKFKNVKALQQLFRSFTDVLTDVPGLKIPKMKGRKVQIVECEQGQFQKNYMEELAKRAENVKNVDPSEDNMLKITSDGRKISYSQRMIDPSLPYEETGKIYKCCDNVYAVYQESSKTRGTQMIFCDMATPKGKSSTKADPEANADEFAAVDVESAQLYDDMKARLVQLGIPEKEIAFIHDAKNDKQKAALSEKMNNGTIRVLIGSTGKMGVGLNAQKKAVAIHHLDAPWRPGDIEQRDGRVFRQKNENEEAYKFVYVTRGSFDSRLWDILERKQKFINQVMNGEDVGNEIEDTGEVTLSAAEVKAVASDNPLIMEQVALEKEISKLQSLQQAHRANVSRAREKIATDRRNIANLEKLIANVQEDIRIRKDTYSSDKVFSMQVGGKTYTDKKDAALALVAAAQAKATEDGYTDIGSFAGFTLRVVKTKEGAKGQLSGTGNYEFKTYPLNPTYGITHLIGVVESLEEKLSHWNKNLSEAKSDLETQKQIMAAPFEQAQKLNEKRARYYEVMDILNPPKEEQSLDSDGGDTVQYQRRKPLDNEKPKKRKKGTTWSETETLFLSWANGSAPIGEVKRFTRFGKHHYYEKTENGCIELSRAQYNERTDRDAEKTYGRIQRQINGAADPNGDAEGNLSGSLDGDRNTGGTSAVSGQAIGEELRNDTRRSVSGIGGHDSGTSEQYQQRTNTLSNREVLALAASELQTGDLSAAERDALDIFQQRLEKLEALQEERAGQGRLYKDQQFGTKADRAAAEQTRSRMKVLDDQIEKAKAEVLDIEDKQVLKQVLQKARKVVEKQQWAKDQESLKRYRDRRNNAAAIKKYRDRLTKDVNDLTNWVLHPNNKDVVKHIPDVLKNSVIPFLSSIDFTSKRQLRGGDATKADREFMKRLNGLKAALKPNQSTEGLYADYSDLPPNFMDRLQALIDSAQQIVDGRSGEFVVNQMTSNELRELSQVVRTLKTFIQQFNRFHANAMFQHVSEAGDNSISELGQMRNASGRTGTVSNFVLWQQIRPAYAFERFGKGGEAIYDGLRRGQATLAFNTRKIQEFAEKAYTGAEVKAWEKQIKSIELGGDIVKMPVSTIMSFYELSKRPQALGHILGAGIRVATFTVKGKKISDTGHTVTPEDLQTIIGTLTDRQKEVADSLQKFMQEQGGKWGNYVSVKRFGEELFGEEHYFPINSDGRFLAANADEHPSAASLYALLNMGFTKAIQEGANNRIVLYSIFDVFANHMASMAQYNAFALPVVDAIKWFNYQQKSEPDENGHRTVIGSVRDQMDRVYGVPEESRPGSGRRGYAQSFVINIIKAFNGTEAQGTPYDGLGMQALHRYNRAQVAYNFRVVVQQPLAITRAAQLVSYRSIIKGMKLNPAAIQRNISEMREYSGIAAWKSLGFYDVNISRGLTSLIKHDSTLGDKITDVGLWGAEKADTLTWAGIWSACKEEVIAKQKLTPQSKGFYEAVTKLFEDVIYKTQVVDSVLTKNEFMRDKGFFARAVGSFMSEPTTTASMLIDAYDKFHMDMQRGMTRQQAWQKNSKVIIRTAYVYGLGAVVLAAVQAVADAFRDDDDYQEFIEKWLEAFGGNLVDELMPINKLPILSDFYEVAKELLSILGVDTYGNPPQSVFMQWYDSLVKGVEILYDKISGEDTNYTWYGGVYKLLQAVSGMTGLPMAAATREIVTAWNNTVGAMAPSLKVKTYDSGEKNEIKYAYQDGWLTYEEATEQLIGQGLVDTEDEAYWIMEGWEAGDGYSRYDALYDAVLSGGSVDEAMAELTAHGYTKKEVLSQIKSQIGTWYYDDNSKVRITKQQAIDMLDKYTDLDSDEITATVNKWSCKVVTGIAFGDIKDEFLSGDITAKRAIEMYVRYGGYTQEKATATVTKWRAEKETGIVYDDIDDAFLDGDISAAEVRNMYITYGGYSAEKAEEKVGELTFERDYPELSGRITYTQYKRWEADGKHNGVDIEVFTDVAEFRDDGTSDNVKSQEDVAAYINSLPISTAQKDALWCCFWKESTLKRAPWH